MFIFPKLLLCLWACNFTSSHFSRATETKHPKCMKNVAPGMSKGLLAWPNPGECYTAWDTVPSQKCAGSHGPAMLSHPESPPSHPQGLPVGCSPQFWTGAMGGYFFPDGTQRTFCLFLAQTVLLHCKLAAVGIRLKPYSIPQGSPELKFIYRETVLQWARLGSSAFVSQVTRP